MKKTAKTIVKSDYGTVVVYTPRHVGTCKLRDRNDNSCSCPKWAYHRAKGGKPVQQALKAISLADALPKANKILEGFHPEIAKAREKNEPKAGIGIDAALDAY